MDMHHPKSFLAQVASFVHKRCGEDLAKTVLVVPSHHVGDVLLRDLACRQGRVAWAPRIETLKSFMEHLSPLYLPERMRLLRLLYDVAYGVGATQDSFEAFILWGDRLLDDFNTIDHGLLSVDKLFQMPTSSDDLALLSEASRSFWEAAAGQGGEVQERWLSLWHFLPVLYDSYKKVLLGREMAYAGLQCRELLAAFEEGKIKVPFNRVVGVGLHAMTRAEEAIFHGLKEQVDVDFCWDYDRYYVEKVDHPAGYYFRHRRGDALFRQALPKLVEGDGKARERPVIEVVGGKGASGQLAALRAALERLIEDKGMEQVAGKAVVVVPDASLLLPLVHSLTDALGDLKVRIGYPLVSTPAYGLLVALLRFQVAWKEAGGLVTDNLIAALEALCAHPYVSCEAEVRARLTMLMHGDLSKVLAAASTWGVMLDILRPIAEGINVFEAVEKCLDAVGSACQGRGDMETWEKVAMQRCITLWMDIASIWPSQAEVSTASYALMQVVHKEAQKVSLPIANPAGERGVEVMSLSQTLGLDFLYVFILSMNEGVLPASLERASFVPHFLQQAFGWSEVQAREAESAYPFYRLLQRAEHVCCLYEEGGYVGERSHYLYELAYCRGWKLRENSFCPSISLPTRKSLVVAKDQAVLEQLNAFQVDDFGRSSQVLSPTALNLYLDCPLCFYLRYVAHIKPMNRVTGEVDPATFGQLFHGVMEYLYRPYVGRHMHADLLLRLQDKRVGAIYKVYDRLLPHVGESRGTDLIVKRVLDMLVEQVLHLDKVHAPFQLLGLEFGHRRDGMSTPFVLSDGRKVGLGGVLDRVDRQGETVRVVDYKTGLFSPMISSLASLFERDELARNKTALQLFLYAWRYEKEYLRGEDVGVMPAVISTRMAWQPAHDLGFMLGKKGGKAVPLVDIRPCIPEFESLLRGVLDELFDPSIPFEQGLEAVHGAHNICKLVAG